MNSCRLIIPDRPRLFCLNMKHFKSVLNVRITHFGFLQEKCTGRIVNQIIDIMIRCQQIIINRRAGICIWRHTQGARIDDQICV